MSDGIWRPEPPAKKAALKALRDHASVRLPAAYLAQLGASNGGEDDLGVEPGSIALWPAEEVVSLAEAYGWQPAGTRPRKGIKSSNWDGGDCSCDGQLVSSEELHS